ncbi:TetR family transcriptional regulator [Janibacter hoylei PVAS-1]|uniref:TetR family transcriptional regulator n=1 Tax=Janibacter hoylei PVAS-1 TaxID=1210046 RepID=A0A444AZ20_9MICO|nr:TetR/AcrR family transcriptional regulator [Janibacter hoylei]RWU81349.1 TetR family transcriptional regulator [Janibacter hoylei PVAS-1]
MGSREGAAGDTSTRIRDAALALFAARGVAATSLREVARSAGVAPGLIGHHFGGKEGLREAVDAFVVQRFREALASVPLEGTTAEIAAGRDAAVARMFATNPEVIDYLRRVVVTPGPGDIGLARLLIEETIAQTQTLRNHGVTRSGVPVTEQAVAVLLRQLGTWLLQPTLDRIWQLSGAEGDSPEVRVTLR